MLATTATALTGLLGVAIVLLGVRTTFWAPKAAVGFGIPTPGPRIAASGPG